jgi:hypothetical protein
VEKARFHPQGKLIAFLSLAHAKTFYRHEMNWNLTTFRTSYGTEGRMGGGEVSRSLMESGKVPINSPAPVKGACALIGVVGSLRSTWIIIEILAHDW